MSEYGEQIIAENIPLWLLQAWISNTRFPALRSTSRWVRLALSFRTSSDSEAMRSSCSASKLDTRLGDMISLRVDRRQFSTARTVMLLMKTEMAF